MEYLGIDLNINPKYTKRDDSDTNSGLWPVVNWASNRPLLQDRAPRYGHPNGWDFEFAYK